MRRQRGEIGALASLGLALDFEAGSVDWDAVRELLDASYRQVALKRMVRALEAEGASG